MVRDFWDTLYMWKPIKMLLKCVIDITQTFETI